MKFRF